MGGGIIGWAIRRAVNQPPISFSIQCALLILDRALQGLSDRVRVKHARPKPPGSRDPLGADGSNMMVNRTVSAISTSCSEGLGPTGPTERDRSG